MTDDVAAALARIEAKLDAVLALRKVAQSDDDPLPARLLAAIAGEAGSEEFTASDVLDSPAVRVVVPGMTAKRLGMLLGTIEETTIAGYRVQRAGTVNKTTLWRMLAVAVVGDGPR